MPHASNDPDDAPKPTGPKISVIVPVYNVATHVVACIGSLIAQSWADFEVIVVDDGSTDGSGETARDAVGADARFRFIHQRNGGLSAARNAGLDAAQGDYICFVDSDDRVAPDFLQRLHDTLVDSGADWVACGVMFYYGDGRTLAHSAIHDAPELKKGGTAQRYDFDDWQEIVRHYPSAWNKIYRRELIGDLRFDEGLHYEDHPFYYRYAARCDHMVHLPEPLYLNTQGREGQITGDGSERVFEQFAVLELMRGIIKASSNSGPKTDSKTDPKLRAKPKTGGEAALADITTRLTFERSVAITNPARRAAFLAQARAVVGDAASDRLGVPAYWMDLMQGRVPVSVIIPSDGNIRALRLTLASLAAQSLPEIEILLVLDDGAPQKRGAVFACAAETEAVSVLTGTGVAGVAGARNRGLDAARGMAVVFLDAGDSLPPAALARWHTGLFGARPKGKKVGGADFGFARFRIGDDPQSDPHSGLHDRAALTAGFEAETGFVPVPRDGVYIHPHPSAKIFRRAFLQEHGLRFPPEPLSSWYMLLVAMAHAQRVVYLKQPVALLSDLPEDRRLWCHADRFEELLGALRRLDKVTDDSSQTRLFVRAVWEKINFADFPDEAARDQFQNAARRHVAELQAPTAPLDRFVGDHLRGLLGLSGTVG